MDKKQTEERIKAVTRELEIIKTKKALSDNGEFRYELLSILQTISIFLRNITESLNQNEKNK